MKVLFLNSSIPNYVVDGLFHGLRSIPDLVVVDVPRMDYMYFDASKCDLKKTGSRGNTLYKLLSEGQGYEGLRTFWQADIDTYDLIIFTDIFHQCDLFHFIYRSVRSISKTRLCIIDGNDIAAKFPYFRNSFNLRVRPWVYFYEVHKTNYFKREFESAPELFGLSREKFPVLHWIFARLLKSKQHPIPISMSIPEQHIEYVPFRSKINQFVNYNVDKNLKDLFPNSEYPELGKWQPTFENQEDYFKNIKESRFGITAKRAGWDCLRHYEYAAKGAILCFKDLDKKHAHCAPLELDDTNCIPYQSKEDLMRKLDTMSISQFEDIQEKQYKWIGNHSTKNVAQRFLNISGS